MGNINPRSKNIPEDILRILNETYEEFIENYGEKHSQYIKEKLEELTEEGRICQDSLQYEGNIIARQFRGYIHCTKFLAKSLI